MSETLLWSHRYEGDCDHFDAKVTLTYEESTMDPSEVAATLPTTVASCGCRAQYVGSDLDDPEADR